jgi:Protein of unknown function (DUF3579)
MAALSNCRDTLMPGQDTEELIISGITTSGKKFRPSDWAERLAGALSFMGTDNRMVYSPYLLPVSREGVKCVIVQRALEREDPQAFRFLMDFARNNELQVAEGRGSSREGKAEQES